MSDPTEHREATLEIRPSLARTLAVAFGGVIFAAIVLDFAAKGEGSVFPAYLAAGVLIIGAIMAMGQHLPGASGLSLNAEGFEIRELYSVKRYPWSEVTEFTIKRRVLGKAVEFAHVPQDGGKVEARSLPTGYSINPYRLLQLMNEWRDREGGHDA
ncbi:MAG: hypothetical protein QF654_13270 [Alphaproteobacteria bacterium]|jgi:hypothetical protein|nr:hypothetical protein [Alphaproteobacteria bacterium]|tara:strand:+ start:433 stop:900 length:468 start_codon:yes stop_codon:yes gene_type:complete